MKRFFICLICCACLALSLFSQDAIVNDTSYIELRNNLRYSVTKSFYASGRIVTDEKPVSIDTIGEVNNVIAQVVSRAEPFAQSAVSVSKLRDLDRLLRDANQRIQVISGRSYYQAIADILSADFIGDYVMRNGTTFDGVVSRQANGNMRYREAGVNYTLQIISRNWIRISQYRNNTDLNLFRDGDSWTDSGGQFKLVKK